MKVMRRTKSAPVLNASVWKRKVDTRNPGMRSISLDAEAVSFQVFFHANNYQFERYLQRILTMNIRLLQNCISPSQLVAVQPGFEAFDFLSNPKPELREFQVFEHLFVNGVHNTADVLGAVSSRFHAKTLVSGLELKNWIQCTPGYEVYSVNPWPQWCYANFNSHERAKIIHRDNDFLLNAQRVLDLARVPLDFLNPGRQHNKNYGMSSYWFGTPRFWKKFMSELIFPVIRLTASELGSTLHDFLYRPITYYGKSVHRAGALPFLLERATSLYVQAQFADDVVYYPRSREQILACCVFPFERDLIELAGDQVDAWDEVGVYDHDAMDYFQSATVHASTGWLSYMGRHPVDFDHGDPRPHLPWFAHESRARTRGTSRLETVEAQA